MRKAVQLHFFMQVILLLFFFSELLLSSKAFPFQHHHNYTYWKIIGLKLWRFLPVNQSYTTQFKTSWKKNLSICHVNELQTLSWQSNQKTWPAMNHKIGRDMGSGPEISVEHSSMSSVKISENHVQHVFVLF